MTYLKPFYYFRHIMASVLNLGKFDTLSEEDNRRIVLTNAVALIGILTSAPYIFWFNVAKLPILGWMTLPFLSLFGISIILNKYRAYSLAKLVVIFSGNLAIAAYSSILGKEVGLYLVTFSTAAVSLVFFAPQQSKSIFISFLMSIITVIFLETTHYSFFERIQLSGLLNHAIFFTSFFTTFLIIFLSLRFYMILTQKFADRLTTSHQELSHAYSKIHTAYTTLKQSREQNLKLQEHAAYATLAKGIGHEVRNPIQMLMSSSEVVLIELDEPSADKIESVKHFATVVRDNMLRLGKLISAMLAYGGESPRDAEAFSLNQMAEDIFELATHEFRARKIQPKLELTPELPKAFGHKSLIHAAILNLLTNALKYTPEHGMIAIRTSAKLFTDADNQDQEGVRIEVSDTGAGIPTENMERIFDPFFTTGEPTGATNIGLGLAFAFRAIKQNHGKLSLTSEVGKGTTFFVDLPVAT